MSVFTSVFSLSKGINSRLSLKQGGEAGSIAEEVISTVRTAQAFGTQKALGELYNEHINKSLRIDLKTASVYGVGLSCFTFVIYSGYALGSSFTFYENLLDP